MTRQHRDSLHAFLIALLLVGGLALTFEPVWASNDDLHMSMIAHGYGSFVGASPNVLYSNVVWGWMVQHVPSIGGVLGYSWASMAAVFAVTWATLYFLLALGVGPVASVLVVLLVIARPVLFPQFTVTAGLLTVAAIIGWKVYAQSNRLGALAASCLLAYCGWLVRSSEFYLVLGISIPLIPWRAIRRRQAVFAALVLSAVLAASVAINRAAYSGPEWQRFLDLRASVDPFVNYGAGRYLKDRPDVLRRHGYSTNDLDLVSAFFFPDPRLANSTSLRGMMNDVGPTATQDGSVTRGLAALRTLRSAGLLPLAVVAFCLTVLYLRGSLLLALVLFIAAIFWIGVTGRQLGVAPVASMTRVCVPPLTLLCIMPLAFAERTRLRAWVAAPILVAACAWNLSLLAQEQRASQSKVRQTRADLARLPFTQLPDDVLVRAWGGDFILEYAYPVLDTDTRPRDLRLMTLGTFLHSPTSVALREERAGRGFVTRLLGPDGVGVLVSYKNWRGFDNLDTYCKERHEGRLVTSSLYSGDAVFLVRARCVIGGTKESGT